MRLVAAMIEELQKLPADAWCYAYEGEVTGLVVVDWYKKKQLGVIFASENDEEFDEKKQKQLEEQ